MEKKKRLNHRLKPYDRLFEKREKGPSQGWAKRLTKRFMALTTIPGTSSFRLFSNSLPNHKEESRMKRLNQIHQKLSLCVFASLVMAGSPAMAKIILPTAVEFDKAISFVP